MLVRLVLRVAGRFQLERAVLRVEVRAQAGAQMVQELIGPIRAQHAVFDDDMG